MTVFDKIPKTGFFSQRASSKLGGDKNRDKGLIGYLNQAKKIDLRVAPGKIKEAVEIAPGLYIAFKMAKGTETIFEVKVDMEKLPNLLRDKTIQLKIKSFADSKKEVNPSTILNISTKQKKQDINRYSAHGLVQGSIGSVEITGLQIPQKRGAKPAPVVLNNTDIPTQLAKVY